VMIPDNPLLSYCTRCGRGFHSEACVSETKAREAVLADRARITAAVQSLLAPPDWYYEMLVGGEIKVHSGAEYARAQAFIEARAAVLAIVNGGPL
jgi:hypothetical protein